MTLFEETNYDRAKFLAARDFQRVTQERLRDGHGCQAVYSECALPPSDQIRTARLIPDRPAPRVACDRSELRSVGNHGDLWPVISMNRNSKSLYARGALKDSRQESLLLITLIELTDSHMQKLLV